MTNTTRRAAATAAAAVMITCVGITSCADGRSDVAAGPTLTSPTRSSERRTAPSAGAVKVVLARAAQQPIRSGRVEIHAGRVEVAGAFDGDDMRIRSSATAAQSAPDTSPAGIEMLVVGGRVYAHTGDAYVRVPFGASALSASVGTSISDTVAAVRRLLEKATVDQPGTPTTVDGVEVTRYQAQLTGTGVADLLDGTGAWRSGIPGDESTRRSVDDALSRARVSLQGDVDASGMLRHLEITVTPDTTTGDCSLLRLLPTTTITLSGIDQPQSIAAPPPDQVKELTEIDPSRILGDIAAGFGADSASPQPQAPPSTAPEPGSTCPR
ncbi:MAG: hypothetical protein JST64_07655 [Actinobacteria bacterium]|nr:hypothetical protein [Actinomycetota bacterium]